MNDIWYLINRNITAKKYYRQTVQGVKHVKFVCPSFLGLSVRLAMPRLMTETERVQLAKWKCRNWRIWSTLINSWAKNSHHTFRAQLNTNKVVVQPTVAAVIPHVHQTPPLMSVFLTAAVSQPTTWRRRTFLAWWVWGWSPPPSWSHARTSWTPPTPWGWARPSSPNHSSQRILSQHKHTQRSWKMLILIMI